MLFFSEVETIQKHGRNDQNARVYMCVHMCVYTHTHPIHDCVCGMYTYVYTCVCIDTHMHTHVYAHPYTETRTHTRMYAHHIHMHVWNGCV